MDRRGFLKRLGVTTAGLAAFSIGAVRPGALVASPSAPYIPAVRLDYVPARPLYVPEPRLVIPAEGRRSGSFIYKSFTQRFISGDPLSDLQDDTLKIALLDDDFSEVYGSGYGAGGKALTGTAIRIDVDLDAVILDADDVQWRNVTLGANRAFIYSPDNGPIAQIDFGGKQQAIDGDFRLQWSHDGIMRLT